MIPCDLAVCCQIYKTAAAELAKTCPVCLHALEDFNTVYAGAPLSKALVRYGNSTLNLLRVANTTLSSQQKPGSAGLSAMASNASLLLRAAGASSGQGRMWGSCCVQFWYSPEIGRNEWPGRATVEACWCSQSGWVRQEHRPSLKTIPLLACTCSQPARVGL